MGNIFLFFFLSLASTTSNERHESDERIYSIGITAAFDFFLAIFISIYRNIWRIVLSDLKIVTGRNAYWTCHKLLICINTWKYFNFSKSFGGFCTASNLLFYFHCDNQLGRDSSCALSVAITSALLVKVKTPKVGKKTP